MVYPEFVEVIAIGWVHIVSGDRVGKAIVVFTEHKPRSQINCSDKSHSLSVVVINYFKVEKNSKQGNQIGFLPNYKPENS